ncbi:hypothetical protein NFI96_030850 [Prochilodus magdalenae]|nr:hypothetical protein NFI96_030850 [Prochilodus magdalenae]
MNTSKSGVLALSNTNTSDPCNKYTSLDQPWRANNETGLDICDSFFNWNSWYRFFYYGMNIRMAESCVPTSRCGAYYTLWLNGPHPEIEDGVVTRQVCGNAGSDCCLFGSTSVKVKTCPGNYSVYKLFRPKYCNMAYCTDVSTITPNPQFNTSTSHIFTGVKMPVSAIKNPTHRNLSSSATTPTNPSFDPCTKYSIVDDDWRDTGITYNNYRGHDDTVVEWKGWYRLYIKGKSAHIAETVWCERYRTCGGYTALWLGGSHPRLEDGIVTRETYRSAKYYNDYYDTQCSFTRSGSVQVKACPGDYYVYKLVKPAVSIPMPTYCAVVLNSLTYDPCHNYISLDQPWRANNETGLGICDIDFSWNGWYRLFYYGMNIRMPESYVDVNRCGSFYGLWLNGPHPQVEDGVVTRQVCGNGGSNRCSFRSTPIRVKACPGSYYVYEFVSPVWCEMAYCTDVSTITPTSTSEHNIPTSATPTSYTSDPCNKYSVLDEDWRNSRSNRKRGHDDTLAEWSGWYRLYLQGKSAQISEWCVSFTTCGGYTQLWLNGSHPQLEDGIVTRDIYGTNVNHNYYDYYYFYYYYYNNNYNNYYYIYHNQCSNRYRSRPIQVKACPGHYYVYKLVQPELSIPMPTYCTVAFDSVADPCYSYVSLDQPWRANNETGLGISDIEFSWNGWYRFFYHGMNIRMSESCVPIYRCGSYYTLWLNGSHPQIEDGVVTRRVCGNDGSDRCYIHLNPIRVKACPGNYYVYELLSPFFYDTAYCTDANTVTPTAAPTTTATDPGLGITRTTTPTTNSFDPCHSYTVLDDEWRNTSYSYWYPNRRGHDDTTVEWSGWYRLFFQGADAQILEGCVSYMDCGGFTSLWFGESHPQIEDGIVTREVYASRIDESYWYRCDNHRKSNPIQVKACPGDYYVYKLVKPDVSLPMPTYCTVKSLKLSYDPCYNYDVLDDPQRATNQTKWNPWGWDWWCDANMNWNGWYRLLYEGNNIRMPESCVSEGMCGTDIPFWLNGSHPQLEDGVVIRQVCGSWSGDCCYFKTFPIRVKACPGNYYVYEFVSPTVCSSAYCADVNTISPVNDPEIPGTTDSTTTTSTTVMVDPCAEQSCTEEEWCGERDGVYGCFCNQTDPRPRDKSYDSRETCESSSGTMSLSRCQLFEAGFPTNVLHLSDPSCNGTLQNGRLVFHFDNDEHICGTNLTVH